jgi:hypothetical protein
VTGLGLSTGATPASAPIEGAPPASVRTIGKYQILGRIATGRHAELFHARLDGIAGFQRQFVIKRILPNLSRDPEYVAMLEEEARIAGTLSHGNIVQMLDLGRDGGSLYLVMEYVKGRDLGNVLERMRAAHGARGEGVPVMWSVFVANALLEALSYAHTRELRLAGAGSPTPLRIVHRDVSPSNVLLSEQGEVKLTDFGLARAALRLRQTHPELAQRRFDYTSPEAAAGRPLDARADLFSVGVLLYELLSLRHPFRVESEVETLLRVRDALAPPLATVAPHVPDALCHLVDRALVASPEDRWPSARAFSDALSAWMNDAEMLPTQAGFAAWLRTLDADPIPQMPAPAARATARAGAPDTRSPAPGRRPAASHVDADEQETLIMQVPPNEWEDDQATVVRPGPRPGATPAPTHEGPWGEAATVVRPRAGDPRRSSPAPKPRAAPTPASVSPAASAPAPAANTGMTATTAGVVSGGIGLVLGALFGCAAALVLLDGQGTYGEPHLRVFAPEGASVTLGGKALSGEVAVPADAPQRIRVQLAEHEPWEVDLTLRRGEQRMLVVTPAHLGAKPSTTPPATPPK